LASTTAPETFGIPILTLPSSSTNRTLSKETFVGIPLTSQEKVGSYYFQFNYKKDKTSYAMLNQIRVFDTKRIRYFSGKISKTDFENLHEKLIKFLNLPLQNCRGA